MWARGHPGPWDKDRHSDLDLCLVFRRWYNSVVDVESDPVANVNTDHLALSVATRQKLKALDGGNNERTLKGAKSESERQSEEYNEAVNERVRKE